MHPRPSRHMPGCLPRTTPPTLCPPCAPPVPPLCPPCAPPVPPSHPPPHSHRCCRCFVGSARGIVSAFQSAERRRCLACCLPRLLGAGPGRYAELAERAYWCRKYARANAVRAWCGCGVRGGGRNGCLVCGGGGVCGGVGGGGAAGRPASTPTTDDCRRPSTPHLRLCAHRCLPPPRPPHPHPYLGPPSQHPSPPPTPPQVALRKILKKHDKRAGGGRGRAFLQHCWRLPAGGGAFLHSPLLDELKAIQVGAGRAGGVRGAVVGAGAGVDGVLGGRLCLC